jgi:hypothetical protein
MGSRLSGENGTVNISSADKNWKFVWISDSFMAYSIYYKIQSNFIKKKDIFTVISRPELNNKPSKCSLAHITCFGKV